jgi:hypothetical protein
VPEIEQTQPAYAGRAAQLANMDDLWANPVAHGAAIVDEGTLEEKVRLLGVPFAILRVTYQSNFEKSERGYVTLEGAIAPQRYLDEAKRWMPPANVSTVYRPGEIVKINDGSTGIRRQITSILHEAGLIDVGALDKDDPRGTFDRPWTEWNAFAQSSKQNGPNGTKVDVPDITTGPSGAPLSILVYHGLRVSVEPTYQAEVYYLS